MLRGRGIRTGAARARWGGSPTTDNGPRTTNNGQRSMILEHVTLRNFCLYRGEQAFDLTPVPAPRGGGMRPIVLFGGTNGAGKTTLLDAIQLALYGTRARCSKRNNLGYDEFL